MSAPKYCSWCDARDPVLLVYVPRDGAVPRFFYRLCSQCFPLAPEQFNWIKRLAAERYARDSTVSGRA